MHQSVSRREALKRSAIGFGHLGLLGSMQQALAGPGEVSGPHFAARAKRVIFLFMHGGPSHVDTFDYKPQLIKDDGKPLPFAKPRVQFAQTGNLAKPRWGFKPYGQSGAMVSDLFPNVGGCVDDLCMLKSVHGTNAAHGGALLKMNTGSDTFVRPSMGSWILYGLGSEANNMPGFVTICPTLGHGGAGNWGAGFLPAITQGTRIGHSGTKVKDAQIPFMNGLVPPDRQRAQLDLLDAVNRKHLAKAGEDLTLEARIKSFELAARMQLAAPEVFDLDKEPAHVRELYGIGTSHTDDFGRQCLLARRMAERGVRFIQVRHGYWDQHSKLEKEHQRLAAGCDRPIAGLLQDLKARGMLEDTLVLWGGEFGRTPTLQGKDGRDHNPHAFTMWMAGGGVKGGMSYGETDEYGYYVAKDGVHVHDLHATILHALGLDHERLTYPVGGRDFRLTDVEGHVVREIFA